MKFDPDDLRDGEVDPVLERLVATLPAERAFAGDDGIVARSAAAAITRRAARTSTSKSTRPSLAPSRSWTWIVAAAAGAVFVCAAVTALVVKSKSPAPAAPRVERIDLPLAPPSPTHAPASEAPSDDDAIPALDVSALPTVAAPKAAAPAPTSAAREPVAIHARTAAEMFASANDARRRRESSAAADLYRELQNAFPSSPEAIISYVTLGRFELDRGRASHALAQFDRYVATSTAELREDALAGRASALENLGRTAEELRAWEALLAEYPRTLLAAHARERVTALR